MLNWRPFWQPYTVINIRVPCFHHLLVSLRNIYMLSSMLPASCIALYCMYCHFYCAFCIYMAFSYWLCCECFQLLCCHINDHFLIHLCFVYFFSWGAVSWALPITIYSAILFWWLFKYFHRFKNLHSTLHPKLNTLSTGGCTIYLFQDHDQSSLKHSYELRIERVLGRVCLENVVRCVGARLQAWMN